MFRLFVYFFFQIFFLLVCGGEFTVDNGTILSPFYPNNYDKSHQCKYEIIAPLGKAIQFSFTDFDVEDNSYPSCEFDYVLVSSWFNFSIRNLRQKKNSLLDC